jgi:hypothetical protein
MAMQKRPHLLIASPPESVRDLHTQITVRIDALGSDRQIILGLVSFFELRLLHAASPFGVAGPAQSFVRRYVAFGEFRRWADPPPGLQPGKAAEIGRALLQAELLGLRVHFRHRPAEGFGQVSRLAVGIVLAQIVLFGPRPHPIPEPVPFEKLQNPGSRSHCRKRSPHGFGHMTRRLVRIMPAQIVGLRIGPGALATAHGYRLPCSPIRLDFARSLMNVPIGASCFASRCNRRCIGSKLK